MRRGPVCVAPSCWQRAVSAPGGVPLCQRHLSDVAGALAPEPPTPEAKIASIVYFVTWDNGETVKIGVTTSPRARWAQLGTGGRKVEVLVAHPGGRLEEQAAHHRFAHLYTGLKEVFHYRDDLPGYVAELRIKWPNWREIIADLQAVKDAAPRRPVGALGRFPHASELA